MLQLIIVLTRIRILKSSSGHVGHWAVYIYKYIYNYHASRDK